MFFSRLIGAAVWLLLLSTPFAVAFGASFRAFTIGNSLTWDTQPQTLDDSQWHVFCNRHLQYIYDTPTGHCITTSTMWTSALANNTYDYVSVQPFAGTTLEQDTTIISEWMQMQPDAVFVLHTGWNGYGGYVQLYNSQNVTTANASDAYFTALEQNLRQLHPDREIRRSVAAAILYDIALDIQSGDAPLTSLSELYRDPIHMSYGDGRYLMHNVMRLALDQGLRLTSEDEATPQRSYLNAKLREFRDATGVVAGDFNADGVVDAADYTVWRDAFGAETEVSLGNAGDGYAGVDMGDYQLWRTNFGAAASSALTTAASAVPEPTAFASMVVLMVACAAFRRT
jgi:hypothetical protein